LVIDNPESHLADNINLIPHSPRIIYIQYTNPAAYPPLEHSSHILADNGWKVYFLGIIHPHSMSTAMKFPLYPKIYEKYLTGIAPGFRQKLHFLWFTTWCLAWILRIKPQYLYVSDTLTTPVALFLHKITHVPVIYHEHDSPESEDGLSNLSRFEQIIARSRISLARLAAFCVLPNQARADVFQKNTGTSRPVLTVWNSPARDEVLPPRKKMAADVPLTLWYHGSINSFRLPLNLIRAIAKIPERVNLHFAGYETSGSRGYIDQLMQIADEVNCQKYVHFFGTLPRQQIIKLGHQCAVGIAFASNSFSINTSDQFFIGATNKPFDYIASGLALLVADGPSFQEMFVNTGYGLSCNPDDVDSIVHALQWFCDHREETYQMGEAGRQRILMDWNYETAFRPVLQAIEETHIERYT